MSIGLKVPSLGESVQQATVGTWLKQEGDAVAADEPVVEVESEKATVALPAPAAGVLRRQLRKTGDTVAVGEVIGELEEGAVAVAKNGAPVEASAAPSPRPAPTRGGGEGVETGVTSPPTSTATPTAPPTSTAPRASPAARRLMAEQGLSPAAVAAGGATIRKDDVVRALATPTLNPAPSPRPSPPPSGGEGAGRSGDPAAARPPAPAGDRERLVPMSPLRRTVARRLLEAQSSAAILTTFNELDMSRVLALRERLGPAFLEKHGVKLGFMGLFVKAAVEALRAYPAVNAEIRNDAARGDAIVYRDHYDLGVAVGGGKGLVVPVVRDCDRLTVAEIEQAIGALATKARDNKITMDDLSGGTFTISNGGIYGSLLSTPILNPPQSGILGLHKIEKRAVVVDDAVVARPMMYVALSYDHRLIDGREAVGFLVKLKDGIEDPERLLLGV